MNDEPPIQNRPQILEALHFALRHKAFLKWKRHDEAESWIAAERILAHLELSNVRMKMGPPLRSHSTYGGSLSPNPSAARDWPLPRGHK